MFKYTNVEGHCTLESPASQWRFYREKSASDNYRQLIHTQSTDRAFLSKALQASIAVLTSISRCTINHTDVLTDVAMNRMTDSYHIGQHRFSFFLRLRSISVVKCLSSMCEALGSTPSNPKTHSCVFLTSMLTFPLCLVLETGIAQTLPNQEMVEEKDHLSIALHKANLPPSHETLNSTMLHLPPL